MRRREFLCLAGSGVAAWSLVVRAQTAMPMIGFLSSRAPGESANVIAAFREGLREAGFVEGQNLAIAFRWAEGRYDRLPALAADLVSLRVAALFAAGGPPSAFAAKAATSEIPIVFSAVNDAVSLGLVASFNRPGGNVTGIALVPGTIVAKQFEALHETVSAPTVIGCLLNPNNPNIETHTREVQEAARTLGRKLELLHARNETEIETTFATLVQKRVGALVVEPDGFFNSLLRADRRE